MDDNTKEEEIITIIEKDCEYPILSRSFSSNFMFLFKK